MSWVSLERDTAEEIDGFVERVRTRPEVFQAWYVTGEVDFVLRLCVGSMEEHERFTRKVFHADPNVRSLRTIVTMHTLVDPLVAEGGA